MGNYFKSEELMHIVFITPGFAKNENDTTTIPTLLALANYLTGKGNRISVIALDYPFEQTNYQWKNVKVYSCGGGNRKFPMKFFTLLKAYSLFKKIQAENAVNILHSFWWQDTVAVGNFLSKKFSIPHLTTLMGQDALPSNNYSKWLSAKGKNIVALSESHAKYFEKTFGRKPNQIIPWGIDKNDFLALENTDRTIDIIGVGWLNEIKNYSAFIDVIYLVRENIPQVKSVIVGDGEQRKMLETKIHALQLQNNISIVGLQSRNETLRLMMHSKVLLHTSAFESFGYVFAEAIYAGATIVSSEVGMANSTNALIGNSIEELAEKVCVALTQKQNVDTKSVFTIGQTAKAYLELYSSLQSAQPTKN